MRISDWSSDVCSSDLEAIERHRWRGNHYPVCQMRGPQRDIPQTLINNHAIESDADAEAYVTRLHAVRPYLGAVVAGLARQAANGVVPPAFSVPLVIGNCQVSGLIRSEEHTSALHH